MASNSKMAIAIHTAGMLAFADQMPVTSEKIAESVGTNAVVIRRLMGQLAKHGLIAVQMGSGGGSRLTKRPAEISLAEIYQALEEDAVFQVPQLGEEHNCILGKSVRPVLAEILGEAENGMIEKLRHITLADVIKKVERRLCGEQLSKDH